MLSTKVMSTARVRKHLTVFSYSASLELFKIRVYVIVYDTTNNIVVKYSLQPNITIMIIT